MKENTKTLAPQNSIFGRLRPRNRGASKNLLKKKYVR